MLERFSHFSFTVADIERSIAFYRDVLGLTLVARQRQDNQYTRRLIGLTDAVLEVAEFSLPNDRAGDGVLIELVEYVQPVGDHPSLRTQDVGTAHVSFVVSDIDEVHARLSRSGAQFVTPPVLIEAGVNLGGKVCYFRDPDGITLELFQPAG